MKIENAGGFELGPEQVIEEEVAAAFERLPPSQRPKEGAQLAQWIGQIAGWPGMGFYHPERRLADQQTHVASLVSDIVEASKALVHAVGKPVDADNIWSLLRPHVAEDEVTGWSAYIERLAPLLPPLADAPGTIKLPKVKKGGRPEQDLFAKVMVRVVCAHLIYVEGNGPSAQEPRESPFPYQLAYGLVQDVWKVLRLKPKAKVESMVKQVLAESWAMAGADFDFWQLLPDVARPSADEECQDNAPD